MRYLDYCEERKHGTVEFPVAFYHLSRTHPRYEMSCHWHMECELIRILEGELWLNVENELLRAAKGDVVYLKGGVLHGGDPNDCIYECMVYNFEDLIRGRTAETLLCELKQGALTILRRFDGHDSEIRKIVWEMFDKMRTCKRGYELAVIGLMYQFYSCILENRYYTRSFDMAKKDARRINRLKKALHLIEDSYGGNLTLKQLADAAQMSEKYFCRFFKGMTHRTPIDYLTHYRIERACFELSVSDSSITEIAFNCGFNDVSYFSSVFKKLKGVTPMQYLAKEY